MSNKITNYLEDFFGPNWRTTIWGGITVLSLLIAAQPDSVAFLPDSIEGYVKGIAGLVTLITGGKFVSNIKDKNVTGGTVPSTHEAEKRIVKDNKENAKIKNDDK